MTWVRLDDRFAEHPKVLGLSNAAFRLHVTALCYVSRHDKDGHVPTAALRALHGSGRQAGELVAADLWHPHGTGWVIHDYLKYNPSKVELEEQRAKFRERARKGAAARWEHA